MVRVHGLLAALIVTVCIGVSSWSVMSALAPKVDRLLNGIADQYDTYVPEITIKNGHASIRREQPFRFEEAAREGLIVVIDTREGKEKEAFTYLKDAKTGLVLTRDSLVVINQGQTRVFPLKDLPDITVNSAEIRAVIHRYLPMVVQWTWIPVITFFLFAKPIQLLVLGMIPYFGARSYSVDLGYGGALKVSSFAMIPPVLLDVFLRMAGTSLTGSFVLYFTLYVGLLILSVWELVKSSRSVGLYEDSIHPS